MIIDDWSLSYTSVSGDENICIGGQKLKVIFAPVFFTCFKDYSIFQSVMFHVLCSWVLITSIS